VVSDSSDSGQHKSGRVVSAFNIMTSEIEENGIMDHEVRAIEVLMGNKKLADGRRKYKIIKHQSKNITSHKKGYAYVYSWGAEIFYCPSGSRLQKMIAIGHELAHIYLKHIGLNESKGKKSVSYKLTDPAQEEEAFEFAGLIARRRSQQYRDSEFLAKKQYGDNEIDTAIKNIYPNYRGTPKN